MDSEKIFGPEPEYQESEKKAKVLEIAATVSPIVVSAGLVGLVVALYGVPSLDDRLPTGDVVTPPASQSATTEGAEAPTVEAQGHMAGVVVDEVATVMVTFLSEPAGATVLIDGTELGVTPLRDHPVALGDYDLTFAQGQREAQENITIIEDLDAPREFRWTASGVSSR